MKNLNNFWTKVFTKSDLWLTKEKRLLGNDLEIAGEIILILIEMIFGLTWHILYTTWYHMDWIGDYMVYEAPWFIVIFIRWFFRMIAKLPIVPSWERFCRWLDWVAVWVEVGEAIYIFRKLLYLRFRAHWSVTGAVHYYKYRDWFILGYFVIFYCRCYLIWFLSIYVILCSSLSFVINLYFTVLNFYFFMVKLNFFVVGVIFYVYSLITLALIWQLVIVMIVSGWIFKLICTIQFSAIVAMYIYEKVTVRIVVMLLVGGRNPRGTNVVPKQYF